MIFSHSRICNNCKITVDYDSIFCPECGQKVQKAQIDYLPKPASYCIDCGRELDSDELYCIKCGKKTNISSSPINEKEIFFALNLDSFIKNQVILETSKTEDYNNKLTEAFNNAFRAIVDGNWDEAAENCKHLKRDFLTNEMDYRPLLFAEIDLYFAFYLKKPLPESKNLAHAFHISNEKAFEAFKEKVKKRDLKNELIIASFKDFDAFITKEREYASLPIKNIAVCATMSAGKSTFVNALLGYNFLPARNKATTARITSIYDRDGSKAMVGFASKINNTIETDNNLKPQIIDSWNDNSDITHIFLQGDMGNIKNDGLIVAIHDTPGVNNSRDDNHYIVTMEFLTTHKIDAIIFVANAEHLCTTDEMALLKDLYKNVIANKNIPIIFILNKADNIDNEKEDIGSVINYYKDFVFGLGFINPHIFPISAKAARLFKMALNGKGEYFTEAEYDVFPLLVKKFIDRLAFDNDSSYYNLNIGNHKKNIYNEQYNEEQLQKALTNTGICRIEKEIEKLAQ